MRLLLKVLLASLAGVCLLSLAGLVWDSKCSSPSEEARRVLLKTVALMEIGEIQTSGGVGDLEARLRSSWPRLAALDNYRIVTRRLLAGYDVVIEPRGWCFCRRAFILHDGGRRLEIVEPALSF